MNALKKWLLGAGVSLGLSGCGDSGPALVPVTGVVKANGQPLPHVMVEFQPKERGSPSIGYTDANGRYQLRFSKDRWGAMAGQHAVRIEFDHDPGSDAPKPPFKIPAQYNRQSTLAVEVSSRSKNHDFELHIPTTTTSVGSRN